MLGLHSPFDGYAHMIDGRMHSVTNGYGTAMLRPQALENGERNK